MSLEPDSTFRPYHESAADFKGVKPLGFAGAPSVEVRGQVARLLMRETGSSKQGDYYLYCGQLVRVWMCRTCECKYTAPAHCGLRICEYCGSRNVARVRAKLQPVIDRVVDSPQVGYSLYLVTLTRRSTGAPTREAVRDLWVHARGLLQAFYLKHPGSGALVVMEAGSRGMVHVHAVVWGPWVSVRPMRKWWTEHTGSWVINVKRIGSKLGQRPARYEVRKNANAALQYILKYVGKVPRFTPTDGRSEAEWLVSWLLALKGTRRIRTYGIFYKPAPAPERTEADDHKVDCPGCGDPCRPWRGIVVGGSEGVLSFYPPLWPDEDPSPAVAPP